MVLFGCGSVAVSVLFDAYQGLPQVALMWGVGVSLAIYATRHLSCAHLNPAVTIAMIAEGFGTFLLVLMILSLTDGCNLGKPDDNLAPLFIGLSVSSTICLLAPLTQEASIPQGTSDQE